MQASRLSGNLHIQFLFLKLFLLKLHSFSFLIFLIVLFLIYLFLLFIYIFSFNTIQQPPHPSFLVYDVPKHPSNYHHVHYIFTPFFLLFHDAPTISHFEPPGNLFFHVLYFFFFSTNWFSIFIFIGSNHDITKQHQRRMLQGKLYHRIVLLTWNPCSVWKSSCRTLKRPQPNQTATGKGQKNYGLMWTATAVRSSVCHFFLWKTKQNQSFCNLGLAKYFLSHRKSEPTLLQFVHFTEFKKIIITNIDNASHL